MDRFLLLLQAHHLPAPETEACFHPTRKWRADYLWRAAKVIIEREGGLFSPVVRAQRAHTMPLAILRDMEKANAAQVLGYRYFRFTPDQLETAACLAVLKQVLA